MLNLQEENARLRMRVAELERENARQTHQLSSLTEQNTQLSEDVDVLTRAVRSGKEQLRLELFLKFGSSSEKYRNLFNIPVELIQKESQEQLSEEEKCIIAETKALLEQANDSPSVQSDTGKRNRNPAHRKRGTGGGRQAFDSSYPRTKQLYKLEKTCPTCGGDLVTIANSDVHEYIDILKSNLHIIEQRREKGYCPHCEHASCDTNRNRTIITADAPSRFIPGGLAGDALIASSLVDKYFYGLSVTRISKRFRNLGVDLSEQNFANWHLRAGSELKPVAEAIRDFILTQPALNADESRIQVLDEKERKDTLKSWMWVICSATPGKPAAYFQYDPSRSSDIFKDIVGEYSGYLQADAYQCYQTDKQQYRFTLALCAAHLRRKFITAQKAGAYPEGSLGHVTLDRIITIIGKIYGIDNIYRPRWLVEKSISEQEFLTIRKQESLPLFAKLSSWIRGRYDLHRDDQFVMEGMNYYLNHEMLFRSYLDCANLNPDNSRVERVIRAFSTIRMNSLFAGCPNGAHAFATMETIIQTANLWDLDLYEYVTYLLKEMTKIRSLRANSIDYSQYLPWNLSPDLHEYMSVHSISIKKKPK